MPGICLDFGVCLGLQSSPCTRTLHTLVQKSACSYTVQPVTHKPMHADAAPKTAGTAIKLSFPVNGVNVNPYAAKQTTSRCCRLELFSQL